jgi:hypothetical protein
MNETRFEKSKHIIEQKSSLKQDIHAHTKSIFHTFREKAIVYASELSPWIAEKDNRVKIEFTEKNINEFWLQVGGDIIIFSMHTNVFSFDPKNAVLKSKYVQENFNRSYCGMIEVYNFLSDSIKFERNNDVGELIARIFINSENHFFVEGEGQLGFLYSDFGSLMLNENVISDLIEQCVIRSLEYDLWAPLFNEVRYIPLGYMITKSGITPHATSKRLGFDISNLKDMSNANEA